MRDLIENKSMYLVICNCILIGRDFYLSRNRSEKIKDGVFAVLSLGLMIVALPR